MSRFIQIRDQYTKVFGRRFLNSQLSFYIGIFQLIICLWSLAQHVYSFVVFDAILFCDFSDNSTLPTFFTGVDAIIFDIGLFNSLWGISGCVAQHLDGGYGRFLWCISHTIALLINMPISFMSRPKPYYMWPLLIQQSAYGIGLLILSLAALPRILPTFMGKLDNAPISAILTYFFGTMINFFLLVVYWHFYWHVESEFNSARKVRTDRVQESHARRTNANRRSPPSNEAPKLLQPVTTIQTAAHMPIANGKSTSKQNGAIRTTPIIPQTNGHVPNGRAAAIANAMRTSPLRLPNGNGPITLLHDRDGVLRRSSAADSPIDGSSITSSSGCSSNTPRRQLPNLNSAIPVQNRENGRSFAIPTSQLSTISLPVNQRPDTRTRSQLEYSPIPKIRNESSRRPSSARNETANWSPNQTYQSIPVQPVDFDHSPPAPHLRSMRRYQSAGNWQRYGSPLIYDNRRLPDVVESDVLTPSPITPIGPQQNVIPFGYRNDQFVPPPAPFVTHLRGQQGIQSAGGRHHSLSTGI
ncbi:hypothetical protein M3Y98_00646000 [Aphelenchoides besseyi]|nr:hypothetical protein M3Y98_00646000 [Aphelenchoides besseyi]KAI6208628.1 hypothetical protein M3Y96_00135100 [Aphelenchoides besseyi]